jgi:flavorubredoxin
MPGSVASGTLCIILSFICWMDLLSFLSFLYIFYLIFLHEFFVNVRSYEIWKKVIIIDSNNQSIILIFKIYWPYLVMFHHASINFVQWKHWEPDHFQLLQDLHDAVRFYISNRLTIDTNNRPHFSSSHLKMVACVVEVKHFPKVRSLKQLRCSVKKKSQ